MNNKSAFTLIELLIVVAIIGILAAIAVPNFLNAQMRAKIARTEADQKAVSTALEQYRLDWGTYVEDHDYPSTRGQRGLFRLTFPVAYMSSLPIDAFASKVQGHSEGNPHFEMGTGSASARGGSFPNHAYIIISPGPNLQEEVSGNDGFPMGTVFRTFAISNGLNSNGDIIRMGGEYSGGSIIADGKYIVGGPGGRPR